MGWGKRSGVIQIHWEVGVGDDPSRWGKRSGVIQIHYPLLKTRGIELVFRKILLEETELGGQFFGTTFRFSEKTPHPRVLEGG
jgi:hypothetical protein